MKLLITTSTLPANDSDKVPAFVKDQAISIKKISSDTEIILHAPHNAYINTKKTMEKNLYYREVRFHYFWPRKLELLTGRAILPALKKNPILYVQIPFLFIFQFFSLFKLVRREKPELIYAHWFTPQAISSYFVSVFTSTPFVFTTHASDISILKKVPFSKYLVKTVCKRARSYSAVSSRTSDKLKSFFSDAEWNNTYKKKLYTLPMGVKLTRTSMFSQKQKNTFMKSLGIDIDSKIILFMGRLAEKKGVEYLLEAYSKLDAPTREKLYVVIAGDGQLYEKLRRKTKTLEIENRVVFTGYVHGKMKDTLLKISDYTCYPSIIDSSGDSEGFPVSIMEALANGKVVLASNKTGAEDILTNGINGFIFKDRSADAIAKVIKTVLKMNESQINNIQKESKKLSVNYDITTITKKHIEFLGLLN